MGRYLKGVFGNRSTNNCELDTGSAKNTKNMCLKTQLQKFNNLGGHALQASISQNVKCHFDVHVGVAYHIFAYNLRRLLQILVKLTAHILHSLLNKQKTTIQIQTISKLQK